MKDNFSKVSNEYSRFRPGYPADLFEFLKNETKNLGTTWDCGTGNGQVALPLSQIFKMVYATDISATQLQNAPARKNIIYSMQPAEKTNFEGDMFDLITVAQAVHWFDFDQFYKEVNRTLKYDGTIAIMGYGLLITNERTNRLIDHLYNDLLGDFWDPERKFIDDNYSTIPFPFREIPVPAFKTTMKWSLFQLVGYLKTWSAVQHFVKEKGYNPVDDIIPGLEKAFGDEENVTFPILFRVGKKL